MLPNAFINKPEQPKECDLKTALRAAKGLWDQLLTELAKEHKIDTLEWNSYSPKAGWSLRAKRNDRNILYLSPCDGCFRASFALSDKAVHEARKSDLPKTVLKIIKEARKYAEGTAVRIEVKTRDDIDVVCRLAEIKLKN
jgi:Protein of unknown function (DUF3788)